MSLEYHWGMESTTLPNEQGETRGTNWKETYEGERGLYRARPIPLIRLSLDGHIKTQERSDRYEYSSPRSWSRAIPRIPYPVGRGINENNPANKRRG